MEQEDWKSAKEKYISEEVPKELEFITEQALFEGKRRRKHYYKVSRILVSAAGLFLCLIIGVNTSTAFAGMMYDIPMLGQVARLLTFTSYQQESQESFLSVHIPEIKNTGNGELEERINREIRLKMSNIIQEAEERAKEYQQAYLKTGGDPETMWKMEIIIDYELKYSTEEKLSFVIWKSESYASYSLNQYFYNIDLKTGKELTLRDLLGPEYKELCNNAVEEGIKKRKAEDEQAIFFGDFPEDNIEKFSGIEEEQPFYLNEKGEVILVFEKYSIAPGYMGTLEFPVIQ